MSAWRLRRRVWWPVLGAVLLAAMGWHGVRSATLARVVVYNDGPAGVEAVLLRWADERLEWALIGPEDSRQAQFSAGPAEGAEALLSWKGEDGRAHAERVALGPGERLVLRLRSDVGIESITRTRAWARDLADWLDELLG